MSRAPKRLIQLGWLAVSAVLVLVAVGSIAAAVRTVVASTVLPPQPGDVPQPPHLPERRPHSTYSALSASPVFGALTPTTTPVAPAPVPVLEQLPVSPLQLRLVGTIAAGPEASLAIIENKGRRQLTYSVGDEISDGAVLHAVEAQRVVLLRNGRQEALEMLPHVSAVPLGARSGNRNRARASSRRGGAPALSRGGGTSTQAAIRRINDNLRVINGEAFQREHGGDMVRTITSMRTQPRFVGGNPSGVTLQDLGAGGTMAHLGFQEGDVIVSVNGQRVNSNQDVMLLAETLNSASDIRVQVIRGNLPRTLIYKVR